MLKYRERKKTNPTDFERYRPPCAAPRCALPGDSRAWSPALGVRAPKWKTRGKLGGPDRSPVLQVRVHSCGGERSVCIVILPGTTKAGSTKIRALSRVNILGVPASGSPNSHHPLSPVDRGEGVVEAEPSTQDAAVARGEGCDKNNGCQRRMLRAERGQPGTVSGWGQRPAGRY